MIPGAHFHGFNGLSGLVFAVVAILFVAVAILTARGKGTSPGLRAGLSVTLLGFSIAMGYEAAAIWQQASTSCGSACWPTISHFANQAFNSPYQLLWGGVYFAVILIGGLLMMHFTRLVQPPDEAQWGLLAAAVMFFVNGALFAFWFQWLP